MKLRQYLHENSETQPQFAARVGYHPITVNKWVTHKQFPRGRALREIVRATGGMVNANDFCADAPDAAQPVTTLAGSHLVDAASSGQGVPA